MPKLVALKDGFVGHLQKSVKDNLSRYEQDEPWLLDMPELHKYELPTPFEVKSPIDLQLPVGKELYDYENTIRIHKALSFLTPRQARDKRLWTRLTHVELWPYMRARWAVERRKPGSDPVTYVVTHYFLGGSDSRALTRNAAARLWWYAHVTYDPQRTNPYELTGVLLHYLDIAQTLLERSLGRVPVLLRAFLEFLAQNKQYLAEGTKNRDIIRELMKAMNFRGGVGILDCMTAQEIRSFLEAEEQRILGNGEPLEAAQLSDVD